MCLAHPKWHLKGNYKQLKDQNIAFTTGFVSYDKRGRALVLRKIEVVKGILKLTPLTFCIKFQPVTKSP